MSAPRWEFYCTLDATPGKARWGWRVRSDGSLLETSDLHFASFVDCHRDALQHGFAGTLEFGPSDFRGDALPASCLGIHRRRGMSESDPSES